MTKITMLSSHAYIRHSQFGSLSLSNYGHIQVNLYVYMNTMARLFSGGLKLCVDGIACRGISTTSCLQELRKLSQVNVVDNSMLGRKSVLAGKKVKLIHIYNKRGVGYIGDKVLLTIMGQKKQAYIVGCRQKQQPNVPRFDKNNVVLIEDNGVPTGTRIRVPIPSVLRSKDGDFTKILSIASKFI